MRRSVHDTLIRCRANEALVTAAVRTDEQDGLTLSELMREAIRERVGYGGRPMAEAVQ